MIRFEGQQINGVRPHRIAALGDALAETGLGRIDVGQVQRIVVAGDLREADDIRIHDRLQDGLAHSELEVFEIVGIQDRHGHGAASLQAIVARRRRLGRSDE